MVFCHERFFRHRRESVLENISRNEKKGDNTIAQTNGKKSLRVLVYFGIYIAQNKILRVRQTSSSTHSTEP